MDISHLFCDWHVDLVNAADHLEYDENHNLIYTNVWDISGSRLTQFEADTGKRILWLYDDAGDLVI